MEALIAFDNDFDFGNGINAIELEEFSNGLEEAINGYNQALSDADNMRDQIRSLERQANDISDRLLSLVGGSYGKDSLEYQRMGGTRKSESNIPEPVPKPIQVTEQRKMIHLPEPALHKKRPSELSEDLSQAKIDPGEPLLIRVIYCKRFREFLQP